MHDLIKGRVELSICVQHGVVAPFRKETKQRRRVSGTELRKWKRVISLVEVGGSVLPKAWGFDAHNRIYEMLRYLRQSPRALYISAIVFRELLDKSLALPVRLWNQKAGEMTV